jgi:hypothetical protein
MDNALRKSKTTHPPQQVPTFSLTERDRRWDIGRKIMDEKDLKALEVELQEAMTFSFEPSCMFGKRFVNLGGTVVVGRDKPIELNDIATRLMRT